MMFSLLQMFLLCQAVEFLKFINKYPISRNENAQTLYSLKNCIILAKWMTIFTFKVSLASALSIVEMKVNPGGHHCICCLKQISGGRPSVSDNQDLLPFKEMESLESSCPILLSIVLCINYGQYRKCCLLNIKIETLKFDQSLLLPFIFSRIASLV